MEAERERERERQTSHIQRTRSHTRHTRMRRRTFIAVGGPEDKDGHIVHAAEEAAVERTLRPGENL